MPTTLNASMQHESLNSWLEMWGKFGRLERSYLNRFTQCTPEEMEYRWNLQLEIHIFLSLWCPPWEKTCIWKMCTEYCTVLNKRQSLVRTRGNASRLDIVVWMLHLLKWQTETNGGASYLHRIGVTGTLAGWYHNRRGWFASIMDNVLFLQIKFTVMWQEDTW